MVSVLLILHLVISCSVHNLDWFAVIVLSRDFDHACPP